MTDHITVLEIVQAGQAIADYLHALTEDEFEGDPMRQDAVVRRIEIIGEAARRLSSDFRTENSDIPWTDIIAMRNLLIHAYDEVDTGEVWRVATVDVPALLTYLQPLVTPDQSEST